MARPNPPFVQRLDGVDLTIEQGTDRAPDRRKFHVFLDGQLEGSFASLPGATTLFRQLRDQSGWEPPAPPALSSEDQLTRERAARDRLAYLEYWGTSHQFRGGGKPKRRQR